jgi:hypothetical protein
MQRLIQLAGGLSSPPILIVVIWCVVLASVAVGPIDYPGQPSPLVLSLIGTGLALFLLAYRGGKLLFDRWFARDAPMPPLSVRALNRAVMVASLLGIVGIALVALDRAVLSGVSNGGYSELLRCAPGLVDTIEIKRTPLLYAGYGMFSFGFVSVVLFLLKGEEITGWAAALGQLSIVSPVGYALLYAGRMPILLIFVLIAAVMLIRLGQQRRPLPRGHRLLLKAAVAVGLFAIYSSVIWTTRQNFCVQMSPLIRQLLEEKTRRGMITATDLSKRLRAVPLSEQKVGSTDEMLEAWNVRPRGYAMSAIESSHLSARGAVIGFSTYFYWTHGVRTVDIVWHARDKFTPQWGVYEIGVLSPFLRVFFPDSQQVAAMEGEQQSAEVFGFFPTVWGAALIDFGIVGAVIYILIWGGVAGWSAAGSKRSGFMTPLLLLVFVLASILLSPVQGPLGIANSALVLVSMLVTGFVLDFPKLRSGSPQDAGEPQLNSSAT